MTEIMEEEALPRFRDSVNDIQQDSIGHSLRPRIKPYYLHGFGSRTIGEPGWRPHPQNALSHPNVQENSKFGGTGQDWFSRLRCAPTVSTSTKKYSIPTQQQSTERAATVPDLKPEYPSLQHDQDVVIPSAPAQADGATPCRPTATPVWDSRNGIPVASPGDNSYQVPEYSRSFHKFGSTRSVVSFGGRLEYVPDTFVPLQDLPLRPRMSFLEKEIRQRKVNEILEVIDLDGWKPSPKLAPSLQLPLISSHF
ncbi:predicted protein [Nematostella vectensis]|uniref:Uncharacterized protein n=1 Tax=Nematostella vectensis TaxID=45351 RepID=A7SUP7_NEMVE|nr:predicted protein [Nematostella vectensis]|eukprot:XP_001624658.1 predicted protein [Nematostella vectensis]